MGQGNAIGSIIRGSDQPRLFADEDFASGFGCGLDSALGAVSDLAAGLGSVDAGFESADLVSLDLVSPDLVSVDLASTDLDSAGALSALALSLYPSER